MFSCSCRADKDSYPHDVRADKGRYRHDSRADKNPYRHDRRADSLSPVYTVAIGINQHQYMRKYNILRLSAANKRSVFVTCTVLECQLNCGATFNW